MNLQHQNQYELTIININQILEKCKSKRELYQFLTQDCKAFLPRIQSTNIYFFKQIMRKEKEYISRDRVKVSSVPHIEGLTVEDFIEYANQKDELLKYLPDQRDWLHLDRQWLCDLLYTLDQENFQEKINDALRRRKVKLEQSRDLLVQMRPEFAQALTNCLNFSHEKGRSVNLLKNTSKRKRTHQQLIDVKEFEEELKIDKQNFFQNYKRLRQEKQMLEDQVIQLSQENQQFAQLFEQQEQNQEQQVFQI